MLLPGKLTNGNMLLPGTLTNGNMLLPGHVLGVETKEITANLGEHNVHVDF